MAKTTLQSLADHLIEVDTAGQQPTIMQIQQIMARFNNSVDAGTFSVLIPSVCAWQQVWDTCVSLGMNPADKSDSATLVCNFIKQLRAPQNAAQS